MNQKWAGEFATTCPEKYRGKAEECGYLLRLPKLDRIQIREDQ